MKNDVILKKIESLAKCIKRLEEKKPFSSEILKKDLDLQDIISVNLERAVQICIDICSIIISDKNYNTANTMADCFIILEENNVIPNDLSLKLQKSVGFRNISVHEYEKIDWDIVFNIITNHLSNFNEFIKYVLSLH